MMYVTFFLLHEGESDHVPDALAVGEQHRQPIDADAQAKQQLLHSLVYAYNDRRKRNGDFRRLWIQRINAAARLNGMTYNRFIQGLNLAGIEVDRRILSDMAIHDPKSFATLVASAKAALPKDVNAPKAS